MQDGPRFFAYSTWVVMISLAIIVFTSHFLAYVQDPGWTGLVALLAFGLVYLNLSYFSVKRFIRKIPVRTNIHFLLAILIFLPPAVWAAVVSGELEGGRFIFILILAFSCWLGAFYGHRSGRRQQQAWLEKRRVMQDERRN